MSDKKKTTAPETDQQENLSLNDDRRVKVLSPGAMVAKRFFRNRLAVLGLIMLAAMFLFSFLGGVLTPYGQTEQFYTYDYMLKEYVGATRNDEYRYMAAEGAEYSTIIHANFLRSLSTPGEEFSYKTTTYRAVEEGPEVYSIYQDDTLLAVEYKDRFNPADGQGNLDFETLRAALIAHTNGQTSFTAAGKTGRLDGDGNLTLDGADAGYFSRFVVQSKDPSITVTRDFKERLEEAIEDDVSEFSYADPNGESHDYVITYDATAMVWSVQQETETYVYDRYADPSREHLLGTDGTGMDMMTRLMYGGRVSLIIGFIVVFVETFIGVILGGISGYFGGWVDNLIMRIVDVFYCIPSMPLIIILGSAMDMMDVPPDTRMLYLMLILGFLGWPGVARLVRGQILSLREQEFMTATEACGISVSRRIFRHLVPNIMPQLIVNMTMGLGSTIITEATLSFLGLGVKFPFASWGNIISGVNSAFQMTNYWFVWIPAGICLLISVLGFNFVGDGLRDAFDPKMKR